VVLNPEKFREESDELLLAAAAARLGLAELASLAAQMYERARGDLPDADPGRDFADRAPKLATTFGGAGVIHGDLSPECAAAVAAVLDALSAPAGEDDDRSRDQRYHDALQEAMRRLVAADLLPDRAGQPVKVWAAIEQAVIGKAVDLLSGPGGLASFLRRRQLGARLGGPSLPLDIGYSETIPAGIRNAVVLRDRHCQWAGGYFL
jgi:hypothetical protein